jgi:hypothetical protein
MIKEKKKIKKEERKRMSQYLKINDRNEAKKREKIEEKNKRIKQKNKVKSAA